MTPIEIRPYRDEDRRRVAQLWLDSWRSTGLPVARLATEEASFDRIEAELAAGWVVHLAWRGESLVGFLALKPAEALLDQLFVAPAAQGSGVGRALFEQAKRSMPRGFRLRTATDNARACRFYERGGMRRGESAPHPSLGHMTVIYRWP